jgi:hypothetical protein
MLRLSDSWENWRTDRYTSVRKINCKDKICKAEGRMLLYFSKNNNLEILDLIILINLAVMLQIKYQFRRGQSVECWCREHQQSHATVARIREHNRGHKDSIKLIHETQLQQIKICKWTDISRQNEWIILHGMCTGHLLVYKMSLLKAVEVKQEICHTGR